MCLSKEAAVTADGEIRIDHAKQDQPDQRYEGNRKHKDREDNQQDACEEQWPAALLPDIEMSESRHDGQCSGAAGVRGFFKGVHNGGAA